MFCHFAVRRCRGSTYVGGHGSTGGCGAARDSSGRFGESYVATPIFIRRAIDSRPRLGPILIPVDQEGSLPGISTSKATRKVPSELGDGTPQCCYDRRTALAFDARARSLQQPKLQRQSCRLHFSRLLDGTVSRAGSPTAVKASHAPSLHRAEAPKLFCPILRRTNRRENRDAEDRLQSVQRRRMLATGVVDHGGKSTHLVNRRALAHGAIVRLE
jgi:hypothetical protein